MKQRILLISDYCSHGTISLGASIPILERMGFRVSVLPTALVSSTFSKEKVAQMDTTLYVRDALAAWDAMGFQFDAIFSGFVVSDEESKIIADFCERKGIEGARIYVDPIMGDDGALYDGVSKYAVDRTRRIMEVADYAIPNVTEACLLSSRDPSKAKHSFSQLHANSIVDNLRSQGVRSVVITSCIVEEQPSVVGYDAESEQYFTYPIHVVPKYFPGTGDIFSSLIMGLTMYGDSLPVATQKAMDAVHTLVERNKDVEDADNGIDLSASMDVIDALIK